MANSTIKKENEWRPIRASLAEDNAGDIYLLEKTLQARQVDYERIPYGDGERAIQALAEDDCIISNLVRLDLNVPRREGFDVLRAIRSKPFMVGVPVGILTSSDAERDRNRVELAWDGTFTSRPCWRISFNQVGEAIDAMLQEPNSAHSLGNIWGTQEETEGSPGGRRPVPQGRSTSSPTGRYASF
jgi:two-component system, chemotaxis family, response regulator Rcp1